MSRGTVNDLRDVMQRQAERRAREGIPPPKPHEPTPRSDAEGEASEVDARALIARLVPSVRDSEGRRLPIGSTAWFNERAAPSEESHEPLAPSEPRANAKRECESNRAEVARKPGRQKGSAPKRDEAPEVDVTPGDEDSRYPLIPAGEHEVRLARVALKQMWNRWVWVCWWLVVEGDHAGVELPMYLPRPPKDREERLGRGWAMSAAYAVATGRRPPKNLARLSPATYLADKQFTVKVVSVERDQFGNVVPPGARYSRVRCLVRLSAGRGPA